MPQGKKEKPKTRVITTTIGEFVEAVYDAAMEEYMAYKQHNALFSEP